MKSKTIIFLLAIAFVGCSNPKEEKTPVKDVPKATEKIEKTIQPTPSADYSSLFTKLPACISASEMAEASGLDASLVKKLEKKEYDVYCKYHLVLPDKSVMLFEYTGNPWNKQDIAHEIKKYQTDKKKGELMLGMDIQTTETGDCYLLYQPMHGRIIIVNANYDTAVLCNYDGGLVANGKVSTFSKEQKLERKNMATKIANYLVKHNRK